MKNNIELSVIIVNYNGYKYLYDCVDSISKSNTKSLEVVVVDNGSNKESRQLQLLAKEYSFLKIIFLNKNYGPSLARNIGVKNSTGVYLCFLDNDTKVDKNWASPAIEVFHKHPKVGVIQSKLLLENERGHIDYVGEYIGQNGFLVQRCPAGTKDIGQFQKRKIILAAKSAGMFIRRKAFESAGGFDDDYFIYVEETDLGWRSWLSGYKSLYLPESTVYHKFGTSSLILGKEKNDYNAKFHGTKNYIRTLIKNLELSSLVKILPVHIFLWLGLAWYSLLKGRPKSFIGIHQAFFWNILHLNDTLRIRSKIQKKRKISDRSLFKLVMKKRNILYYVNKVTNHQKIGNAESFFKKK